MLISLLASGSAGETTHSLLSPNISEDFEGFVEDRTQFRKDWAATNPTTCMVLETTIVGHLTGRLLTDPIVASRQQLTRQWWTQCAGQYDLFISQLVIDECGAGAASAAGERLNVIQSLPLSDATLETDLLAAALIAAKAIPETEPRDAFHISIAATNGLKYLLTWNFKHIANATLRKRIESVCRNAGYEPPTICTPDELMGLTDDT
jgi:predicted nucleic acid-binding protein